MSHGISVEVIERDVNQIATNWLATCGCKERFAAPTYEQAEDKWRQHVHAITGKAPAAMGIKTNRWMP